MTAEHPTARPQLAALLAGELARPIDPAVQAIAAAARAAHGEAVAAVLFYGSCLRDGYHAGLMVDLYVLVDDYAAVHRSALMRELNRLVPPNVYYLETPHAGGTVRAKYALVSLPQFERRMRFATSNPYFWARFAQPTGLAWARDAAVAGRIADALAQACATCARAVRPLLPAEVDAAELWARALSETYRTELRSERADRARAIVAHDAARYRRVTACLVAGEGDAAQESLAAARRHWARRRWQGKALSVLRLIKASFTFAGGGDYLAWKINRHATVPVEFSPWERRHPLLAAPGVLWRLARRGVIR